MNRLFKLKRFWFVLLCIPAAWLTLLAKGNHEAAERIYSSGLYPVISGFFGRITGLFPFSLAQWILVSLVIFFIIYIPVSIRKIITQPFTRAENAAKLAGTLLCSAGIIWFGFVSLCGINYHRLSFAEMYELDVRPSSTQELEKLCTELAASANSRSQNVKRDEDGAMLLSDSSYSTAKRAGQAYTTIGIAYPALSGFTPRAKPVIGSKIMSMADLVGVYFPFTFEANVNVDVPAYEIPSSMLHELSHYKGFMREDEANFISYIACVTSGDDDFAYSGTMLALIHSINALYSSDKDAYWRVSDMLNEYVKADFRANDAYWKQFEGPVAEVAQKVNDVYLKTNSQPSGVKSYGEMVDLLLAYRRSLIYGPPTSLHALD